MELGELIYPFFTVVIISHYVVNLQEDQSKANMLRTYIVSFLLMLLMFYIK